MKKGFTLLELIVVIIIIGILGSLGFIQYTKVVEKGRSAEAKDLLGQIRTAQQAYSLETNGYSSSITSLYLDVPTSCTSTHYFSYSATNTVATATRCTGTNGKSPGGSVAYTIVINYATGTWSGSAGYY